MKKKHFLGWVVLACMAIAYVANMYPIATIGIALCSLPFVFLWCLMTTERNQDKAFKEREQHWRNNCDLSHRKNK